jgi:rRNA large subunit m3Psi methyltransferase RlmH
MDLVVFTSGVKLAGAEKTLFEEYAKRINRRVKFSVDISEKVLKQVQDDVSGKSDFVVVLDEKGEKFNNLSFAKKLDGLMGSGGYKRIVFVIGGAYGIPKELKLRANLIWSFSEQIFPHKLFAVMLAEQIYRNLEIIAGSPYHHS